MNTSQITPPSVIIFLLISTGQMEAAGLVEPERCIVENARGNDQGGAVNALIYNCNRQFILAADKQSKPVDLNQISDPTIYFIPPIPTIPRATQEQISLKIKNNSNLRIVSAEVVIQNRETGIAELYKLYPAKPIQQYQVGTLDADVLNLGDEKKTFWEKYSWRLHAVNGIQ